MTAAQTARALSFREFSTLCSLIDNAELPKPSKLLNGAEDCVVAPLVKERKFNVLRVQRELGRVYVNVDLGRGIIRWINFEMEKDRRAAA